jgi:hypothetical protein
VPRVACQLAISLSSTRVRRIKRGGKKAVAALTPLLIWYAQYQFYVRRLRRAATARTGEILILWMEDLVYLDSYNAWRWMNEVLN